VDVILVKILTAIKEASMDLKKTIMFYADILADSEKIFDFDVVVDHIKKNDPQCDDSVLDSTVKELEKEGFIAFVEWHDLGDNRRDFSRLSGHDRFYRII